MKRFIGFIKKEFYHIFRDKRSLFILFGMPIAQILLFGFAITNEINNVDIAVLDHSKDVTTQEIINKISASKYFTIETFIEREADIEAIFKKGKIKAVLTFEKDFGQYLMVLLRYRSLRMLQTRIRPIPSAITPMPFSKIISKR